MTTPPPLPPPKPADLAEDLIAEILLLLPPYKPGCLVRCSAVSKQWRRVLTNPVFLRCYLKFHGTPPMLGFLFNLDLPKHRFAARFVRTTAFRPRTPNHPDLHVLDSRHGRVLLHSDDDLVIWNPVTDERWDLPMPPVLSLCTSWNMGVLCAAAPSGCNHLGCHRGHFLVAFVGDQDGDGSCACVYSSAFAAWSNATNAASPEHPEAIIDMDSKPSALVGNKIYFLAGRSRIIVEYDLIRHQLASIDSPFPQGGNGVLMPEVGGGLGFAGVRGSRLYLWSREAGPGGAAAWMQRRAIELNILPTRTPSNQPTAVGFAEGVGAIFISTDAGVFAIDLKSGRVKKVSSRGTIRTAIPYMASIVQIMLRADHQENTEIYPEHDD